MDKVTYRDEDAQTIRVYLGSKRVGMIRESKMGFKYFSLSGSSGGFYPTLEGCKKYIEE